MVQEDFKVWTRPLSMSGANFLIRRPTPVSNESSDVDANGFKVPAVPQRLRDEKSSRAGSPLNPNGKRPLNFDDSDEEETDFTEELVVGFDAMGAQRANDSLGKPGPLVIPALPNKDWKAIARKRKNYVPDEGRMKMGGDSSQGGLGTRDTINAGPQQSGLVVFKKRKIEDEDHKMEETEQHMEADADETLNPEDALTDEQRAVNALLNAAKRANDGEDVDALPLVAIPMMQSKNANRVEAETKAFQQDTEDLPDEPDRAAYERMPVSQFGTALLMGMGWKPGQGASKSGKGPVEAKVPAMRPALLGLGAKPDDSVTASSSKGAPKPSKRYIPIVAKEREREGESSREGSRPRSDRERERDRERDRRDDDSDRRDSRRRDDDRRRDERRDDRKDDRREDRRDDRRRDDRRRDDKYSDRRDDKYSDRREEKYSDRRDDKYGDRRDDRDRRDDSRRRR